MNIFKYFRFLLPQSLKKRILVIVIGGVLLSVISASIIHIIADSYLIDAASHDMEVSLKDITQDYLTRHILSVSSQINLRMEQVYSELRMLSEMTQIAIDNDADLQPLIENMKTNSFFKDHLKYYPIPRHSQNDPSEPTVVSVQDILHTSDHVITDVTQKIIDSTMFLDLIMPPIHHNGTRKLWTYFIGGRNSSFIRMTPWVDYAQTLETYPNHMDQSYWDYWPGLLDEWERMLHDNTITNYITSFTPYKDGPSGELITTFAQPIWNANRTHVAGAFWIDLYLNDLITYIEQTSVGEKGFAFLSQPDYNIIAIPYKGLKTLGIYHTTYFDDNYDLHQSLHNSIYQNVIDITFPHDQKTTRQIISIDNNEYIILLKNLNDIYKFTETHETYIEKQQWVLGFVLPISEIYIPISHMKNSYQGRSYDILFIQFTTVLIIVPILIYITYLFTKKATISLSALSESAKQVSIGNYETCVPIVSNGEIGGLAKTFNTMIIDIKKGFSDVEDKNELLSKEIAERKIIEHALKQSEERYRKVVETSLDSIVISNTDGIITYANPEFYNMHNIDAGIDVVGTSALQYIDVGDHIRVKKSISEIISGDRERYKEFTCIRQDGTRFPVESSGGKLELGESHDQHILIIAKDITERKQHEADIIRAKQEWEKTFDTIPDMITILDKTHTIRRVNKAMANRVNLTPQDLVGKHCYHHMHGTTSPPDICPHQKVLRDGEVHEVEVYEPHLDGYFLISASPIIDANNIVMGSVHVAKDISQRKSIELALKDSEERFRGIVESTPLGIHMYHLDKDKNLIFDGSNPAATTILGIDNKQYIGQTIEDAFPPLRHTEIPSHYKNAASKGIPWKTEHIEYTDNIITGIFEVTAFQTEMNTMVALFSDITTRKLAEIKIREQEENLRVTLNSIGDGVITTDINGKITRMNPVSEKLCCISFEDAYMKEFRSLFYLKDELTQTILPDPITRVLNTHETIIITEDTTFVTQCDVEFSIMDSIAPIKNDNDKIIGTVMVFQDNTEERLRQRFSEARIELIEYSSNHTLHELLTRSLDIVCEFANSPIGFYHFVDEDQETISLQQWSTKTLQNYCTVEGHDQHYPMSMAGVWIDAVKEKAPVIHNDYESLSHKKGLPEGHAELIRELVVPVIRSDKVVAILGIGNKDTDYIENDIKNVSYLADVTWEVVRQKRSQEYIRKERDKAQQYLDIAGVIFLALDKDGCITLINQKGCEVLKCSDDIIGTNWFNTYIPEDIRHETKHMFKNHIITNETFLEYNENEIITSDNEIRMIAWHNIVLRNEDGDIIGTLSSGEDITQRKQAQERLHSLNEHLEEQVKERTDKLREAMHTLMEEEKMAALGRLVAGIVHEINTPNGVAFTAASYLQELIDESPQQCDASAKIKQSSEMILNNLKRSSEIITNFKQLAIDQVVDDLRTIQLKTYIDSVLQSLHPKTKQYKNITITTSGENIEIETHPGSIAQIITNLVTNSLIHAYDTTNDSGKITIDIKSSYRIIITYRDDGCGMDEYTLKHIYEPFFTTKQGKGGSGLGMNIVYNLITNQLKGTIHCESSPEIGTTFTIIIPQSN